MIDHATHATADALSLTQAAMRERCGITVVKYDGVFSADRDEWFVYRDLDGIEAFDNELDAYTFANELAEECIEAGDLHV